MIYIQNRPATMQIQPIGFSGRLDAIKPPTTGKARKGEKISRLLRGPAVPQSLGGCVAGPAYKDRTVSAKPSRNMATERAASDHASQEAVRPLIPLPPLPAVLILLSQHHSTGFPALERYEIRYEQSEPSQSESIPRGEDQARAFLYRNRIGSKHRDYSLQMS
jgi:hypothetical protein